MAQKIVITETAPAEHWPMLVDTRINEFPKGAAFLITETSIGYLCLKGIHTSLLDYMPIPDKIELPAGHSLFFKSAKDAFRWWLDPQPIEPSKSLTFADLAIGDYFVVDDGVFNPTVELKISNEFSTITSWNSIQIFPTSGQRTAFAHDASVTAFRGTIEVKGKE